MRLCSVWARFMGIAYHSIFFNRPIPISIVAVPQAVSTLNLPGSEITLLSLSWYISYIYGFITLSDKQSISTLESESAAAVAMLNNALAGRNRSASVSSLNRHASGRRRPVRRAKTRAVGPISALWEWDQDENYHQAQLDT